MSVNGCVPSSTSKVLSISVRNVFTCLRVSESLGKSKINDVHIVLLFANPNKEIIRFNIPVKEVSGMNKLNSLKLIK